MDQPLGRVAVFCASSPGVDPELGRAAYEVGRGLAERGIGLVYGGGGHGLMGDVSQGALDAGGEVIGVLPHVMIEREWGRDDLTELHLVDGMHERKAMMADLADAFLCLPGGLGTLEEIFEVWSWRQLKLNPDPVAFLNTGGFWTPMLDALQGMVDAGFLRQDILDDLVVAETLDDALAGLAARIGTELRDKL
ncbi:LOG family protein [Aeromicrobium terrae]|uniref:Cytokinin riboside 5'-monophosphate phosphoribohydrolase n=1 Tax=Aeromicrobium terrae TaxID=2498846 RepID=A0A5C8ND26_9ACTN|nr:TIGR00730 family Rossman fold protein [Aeromicrobium terrae]TXL57412.1 TIGR00730 family Rossman fold protein [Aeromicrobium terrae]